MSTPLGRTAPTWVLGGLGPDAPFPGPTCALERSWAPLALSGEQRNTPGGGAEEKRALESAFVLNGKENAKSWGDSRKGVNTEALEKELVVGLRASRGWMRYFSSVPK